MICPVCASENNINEEKSSICPFCGSTLDYIEPEGFKQYPWVLIYTTNTVIDAEMFRANLERAKIPTRVVSQVDSTRMFTIGALAIAKIYVPSYLATEARKLIDAINLGEMDILGT